MALLHFPMSAHRAATSLRLPMVLRYAVAVTLVLSLALQEPIVVNRGKDRLAVNESRVLDESRHRYSEGFGAEDRRQHPYDPRTWDRTDVPELLGCDRRSDEHGEAIGSNRRDAVLCGLCIA